MKNKQILITLGLLFLLGSYFYFVEYKKGQTKAKEKADAEAIFAGMRAVDIVNIKVKNEYGEFTVGRSMAGWNVIEPRKLPGDEVAIEAIVKSYLTTKIKRTIEGANATDFGISENYYIEILDTKGKRHTLMLGDDNPTGSYVYALRKGLDEDVLLVDNDVKRHLDKTLFHFRYKGIFNTEEHKVSEITVNIKGAKYKVIKQGVDWVFKTGGTGPVKKQKIVTLVKSFKNSSVKSFEKPDKKYGIGASGEYIELTIGKDKKRIDFGEVIKERNEIMAGVQGEKEVLRISDYVYRSVPKPGDLVNKQLLVFESDQVGFVKVRYDDKYFEAEKKGPTQWEVISMQNIKAKKEELNISGIVNTLYLAQYKEKYKNGKGVEKKYTNEENFGIVIELMDIVGAPIGTFVIGNKFQDGNDIYVQVPKRDNIYKVGSDLVDNLKLPDMEVAK